LGNIVLLDKWIRSGEFKVAAKLAAKESLDEPIRILYEAWQHERKRVDEEKHRGDALERRVERLESLIGPETLEGKFIEPARLDTLETEHARFRTELDHLTRTNNASIQAIKELIAEL
jgi:hypothetical protein